MNAATVTDAICQLMKRESETVGFIPRPRVREHVTRGLYQLQIDQNEIVGYIIHGPYRETLAVHQCVVDLHARRLDFATVMEATLTIEAYDAGSRKIRLQCRDDLPANQFWLAAGYTHEGYTPAGVKRRHPKRIWVKDLVESIYEPTIDRIWCR